MDSSETLKIQKSRLIGKIEVSGAKNSALRLLAASILTNETIELFHSPNGLLDMKVHSKMLEILCNVRFDSCFKLTNNL